MDGGGSRLVLAAALWHDIGRLGDGVDRARLGSVEQPID